MWGKTVYPKSDDNPNILKGKIMVTQKTKFSISIEKLEIKFEGTQERGQQIQQGVTNALGSLLNTQAHLLSTREEPIEVVPETVPAKTSLASNGQSHPDLANGTNGAGNSEKPKQVRQRRTKGVSVANLLVGLKQDRSEEHTV